MTINYLADRLCQQQGLKPEHAFARVLSQPTLITVEDGGKIHVIKTVPGRQMKFVDRGNTFEIQKMANATAGPQTKHKVMVIGGCVNRIEAEAGISWLGDYAKEFLQICNGFDVDCEDFYYTTAVKHDMFVKKSTIPKTWINWSKELLDAEIEMVDPEVVILLGAKVLKIAVGNQAKISDFQGRVFGVSAGALAGRRLVSCTDPSSIIYKPENRDQVRLDLSLAAQTIVNTGEGTPKLETDYTYIRTLDDLNSHIQDVIKVYDGWLAVDCEWSGQNHLDGYLKTIQMSWEEGKANAIVFVGDGDQPTELGLNLVKAWKILKTILEAPETKIIGHFIRADLPWLKVHGCSVDVQTAQGWDTALAGHLLNENWRQSLETYTLRHTDMGRYDAKVKAYIKNNKAEIEAFGFKHIPEEILLPYAAADADATFRIFRNQQKEMALPENEQIKELYETVVMPATLPILEMEMEGIKVDQPRLMSLAKTYTEKLGEIKNRLAVRLNWPDYNPDSPDQKVEALFGMGKKSSNGTTVLKSPEEANLNTFIPVKRTDDNKPWLEVLEKGLLDESRPSTDRASIQTLLILYPDDMFLQDSMYYSAVSQAVKTFTGKYSNEGLADVKKGLLSKMWPDGKVHCRIRQTVETGRYGHSGPNMAQLPKSAESLLSKAFDGQSTDSIRSCFMAEPGWCFVDADWVGAELFVMAWLSGDTAMQERLTTPGVDFHSETALDMFQLDLPPEDWSQGTKAWIKENGNSHLRTIAKTITFGIAYGRGAAAIKEEVYRQGIDISIEEAQDAIHKFRSAYPQLSEWLNNQKTLVTTQGYVNDAFGRRRRFESTEAHDVRAHQERQAMNMPIQGSVGDLMSLALVNLYVYRWQKGLTENKPLNFRILMSVHDQILLTCPIEEIDDTLEALKVSMCDLCDAPGLEIPLQIDREVSVRWGEPLTLEDAEDHGIDLKHTHTGE